MGLPRLIHQDRAILIALVLLTAIAYCRVAGFDFVSMDDYVYVAENGPVRSGLTLNSIKWAFTTTHAANWHPATWLSLMLDTDLSGYTSEMQESATGAPDAQTYHITNLVLHILCVVLLYVILARVTGSKWRSGFVAALFGLHPLHVESVAWVTERKDVLSTALWLLVMLAYVRYTERKSPRRYALVAALFALGLMAKPMLVSLPIVLLLMDLWPLKRLPNVRALPSLLMEKAPLFALAAASCAVTFWAQRAGGAVQSLHDRPFGARAANAVVSGAGYLRKTIYPAKLGAYYPHPGSTLPVWEVALSAAVLLGITALALRTRRSHPYIITGWLWYLVTLTPVIGLVQVGDQAMADRYTYVPLIGIFLALAWAVPETLGDRQPLRVASGALAALVVGTLTVLSFIQVGYWRNGVTLFRHTVAVTSPRNAVALFNLGVGYEKQASDPDQAVRCYRAAIKAEPKYVDAHYNLGNLLAGLNRPGEAWDEYCAALKLNPGNSLVHGSMGYLLAKHGRVDAAIIEFREALRIDPKNSAARYNLEMLEDLKRKGE